MKHVLVLLKGGLIIMFALLVQSYFNIKHNYVTIVFIMAMFIIAVVRDRDGKYKKNGKINRFVVFVICAMLLCFFTIVLLDIFL